MLRLTEVKLPLDHTEADLRAAILQKLKIGDADLKNFSVFKRSYDARKKNAISLVYALDIETPKQKQLLRKFKKTGRVSPTPNMGYRYVAKAPNDLEMRPIVIGVGPCGMFAALLLAQMGFRPIVLERGKAVHERSQDTFGFWSKRRFNPESNAQFGEGGAGTFSDGKLYSRIKDNDHHGRKVLHELVENGAVPEILYISKPHIGTYRLVKIVENIRNQVIELGGEIRFQSRVEKIELDRQGENRQVRGVTIENGDFIASNHVVLAVGHSARDTFEMLHQQGVYIEPKPFSVGFRIEHPQPLINQQRYGDNAGNPILGAADYKLVHHCANGRTVYSFCMCPGGQVVAATSEIGRVVTNGMSQYERSGRNANSGIVVGITPEVDYPDDPLGGVKLQRQLETNAFKLGGETYEAPGQLVGDFLAGKASTEFGQVKPTYRPGVHLCDLSESLPDYAIAAIREAIPAFDKKIKGFAMKDAVLTGVETRTSSPIRIKRDERFQSLNTPGLYPAGEGAGYAGGILSAAVDGIKVAEAVALSMVAANE
ncbi:Pyridine nucleotide-disulphide oxidoreductase, putative [Synechococcus sp. PCC 7335]|uniref:NAD(P)/FAD-dependent oxidoreductase n=1 Tax=Synechococcus sp. (strain ATCC 29403 / PCC 7335) TaxID=91464 RepID=UPI00017EBC7B|nr:NAD(P)/FAD-dependent oxidoreductase [Synechococcus sp. PCC 7335]EDX85006.1 Pyridine nucleotide-disulphide oxidoreductase, putative [Synechococcus sp. PCC 7335]